MVHPEEQGEAWVEVENGERKNSFPDNKYQLL